MTKGDSDVLVYGSQDSLLASQPKGDPVQCFPTPAKSRNQTSFELGEDPERAVTQNVFVECVTGYALRKMSVDLSKL